jgi:tetratricopeptide (TPR) repeat protein
MNEQPGSSDSTAASLDQLATAAKQVELRAHRRTLAVTISIAFVAIVAMSVWSLALRNAAETAREQAQIADRSYQLALTAANEQLAELEQLLTNGRVTVATAKTLLAPMANTLAGLESIQANPDTTKAQIRLLLTLSDVYSRLGNVSEALTRANQAKSLGVQLASANIADTARLIFDATWRIGDLLSEKGQPVGAIQELESALNIARQAVARTPNDLSWQTALSLALVKVGDAMWLTGRLNDATRFYSEALSVAGKATSADPNNASAQRDVARVSTRLGNVFLSRGAFSEALSSYERALSILDHLTTADPSEASLQLELALVHTLIGGVQRMQNDADQTIMSYRSAIMILERLVALDSSNVVWQAQLARTLIELGDALTIDSRYTEAREQYNAALLIQEGLAEKFPEEAARKRIIEVLQKKIKSLDSEQPK